MEKKAKWKEIEENGGKRGKNEKNEKKNECTLRSNRAEWLRTLQFFLKKNSISISLLYNWSKMEKGKNFHKILLKRKNEKDKGKLKSVAVKKSKKVRKTTDV